MEPVTYRKADLAKFLADITAARSIAETDAAKCRDEGTSVLGAGVAVRYLPPGCRKSVRKILVDAPFQGNVGSKKACARALEFLRDAGVDAFWHDGEMD